MEQKYFISYYVKSGITYSWFENEEDLKYFIKCNLKEKDINEIFFISQAEDISDEILER